MTDEVCVTRRKRGRPTLYTPDRIKVILETIRVGGSDADACAQVDIDQATFCLWMNNKSEFFEQVTRARALGKLERIKRINAAAKAGDWRADAWYLERRWPDEFGQRVNLKIDVTKLSDSELEEIAAGRAPKQLGSGT